MLKQKVSRRQYGENKLRKSIIFRHSQGDQYKTIVTVKVLNISRDTIGSIVRKCKACGWVYFTLLQQVIAAKECSKKYE